MSIQRIGIIGAGAWGTALAVALRRAGRKVIIQSHEPEVAAAINSTHANPDYLPGVELDPAIVGSADPSMVSDVDAVLLVAPAQHLRSVCKAAAPHWKAGAPAVICAKGIEQGTSALMSEVAAEALPEAPIAVLSGPSFAIEAAKGLPTAVTLAAADHAIAQSLSDAISTPLFRAYVGDDLVGAQLGGAVKNVLAIGCGIAHGREMGDNARAALITRGLAEMVRLGLAMGAKAETFMGLSGLGDLVLTCNAMQSRNFSLGVALGRGESLQAIMGGRRSVAEGVHTAASVVALADRFGVDMPICHAVDAVINRGARLNAAIHDLLARPIGDELA